MTATVAGWITYAGDRGNVVGDDAASAAALVRATDYITHNYVRRFVAGYDATSPYVDEATYEAANLELATPGFFSKTFTEAQQKVLTGVDSIRWTAMQSDNKSVRSGLLYAPTHTKIDAMLADYMPLDRGLAPILSVIGKQSDE